MGKGSRRRKILISKEEEDLKWELIKSTSPERKTQIKALLQTIKENKDDSD